MEHLYKEFKNTDIWYTVEQALENINENNDVSLQTQKELVVGYLCKQIKKKIGK